MEKNKVGSLALIVGLIIAVLAAFGVTADWLPWVVAVLGLIIGLLNISGAESQRFLLAAIGLILTATAVIERVHQRVRNILSARRNMLDEVARLLSTKEIVQGDELRKILGKTPAE